jgi:hypothetical protein
MARAACARHAGAVHAEVRIHPGPAGALLYEVPLGPEALPPVAARDLIGAWDAARAAAERERWGEARAVLFRRAGGEATELVIADADARCWAAAVDQAVGLDSLYGLALCFRLLGLIELLATAPWARGLFDVAPEGTTLHPALLAAAARAPLAADGRFDQAGIRRALATRLTGSVR